MTAQAEQGTYIKGMRALRNPGLECWRAAVLPEGVEAVEERRVFFNTGAGAEGRRKASRLFCSTSHSTDSPRSNSMAWARAEGKLIYHCSLALRLMSCTFVKNPMRLKSSY